MIDKRKFGISICLWIISSLLGIIPIFFEFVDWYLNRTTTSASDVLEKLVSSDGFYFGLVSALLASLIELVLATGNKYYPLIFINIIFDIIILVVYNLSYFRPEFFTRLFSISSNKDVVIGWFVGVVSVVAIIMGIINVLFLSFIPNKTLKKMRMMQLNSVKVY